MQHVTLPWHPTSFQKVKCQSIIVIFDFYYYALSSPKEACSPYCLHKYSQGVLQHAPHCHDNHWCHSRAGALRSCDPDRLVIKKVVLSGYPVKVHKKKAFVRWMFFGPEDVRWFRPVELWTKHGRRGRIKVCTYIPCLFSFCNTPETAVSMARLKYLSSLARKRCAFIDMPTLQNKAVLTELCMLDIRKSDALMLLATVEW
jgi:hypothetical protein